MTRMQKRRLTKARQHDAMRALKKHVRKFYPSIDQTQFYSGCWRDAK